MGQLLRGGHGRLLTGAQCWTPHLSDRSDLSPLPASSGAWPVLNTKPTISSLDSCYGVLTALLPPASFVLHSPHTTFCAFYQRNNPILPCPYLKSLVLSSSLAITPQFLAISRLTMRPAFPTLILLCLSYRQGFEALNQL